jgi:phage tail sheath protein FI
MPVIPSYPGVYVQEERSNVRTIVGVATSITAFVGRALRGPVNDPVIIHSFADYQRQFGGMWADSPMSYAVQQYYANGGVDAVIVRVHNGALRTQLVIPPAPAPALLSLEAADPGAWGDNLRARVDLLVADTSDATAFNLFIEEIVPGTSPVQVRVAEAFRNVSSSVASPRYVQTVLAQESRLVRATAVAGRPATGTYLPTTPGINGSPVTATQVSAPALEAAKEGLWALEDADLFNLLVIPPFTRTQDIDDATRSAAIRYCETRRAIFLLDPPATWDEKRDLLVPGTGLDAFGAFRRPNAALYWPRLRIPDPLQENRLATFVPSGVMAGLIARIDAQRGVWKAPAGQEATLNGVAELEYKLTDLENGDLNPLAVNCLRTFPVVGTVAWGARTFVGADRLASEWKYLPVRRLALYIEETLYRATQWVVFEPNDEPLWSQIRLNVGAFMHRLYRQGAFQGRTPRDAYLVKCDAETTPQADIDAGIVNVVVGFAPLKPAEFVIITIRQLAGQVTPA